jgi:hypothetical protein
VLVSGCETHRIIVFIFAVIYFTCGARWQVAPYALVLFAGVLLLQGLYSTGLYSTGPYSNRL